MDGDTLSQYAPGGRLLPERAEVHRRIISWAFEGKSASGERRVTLMAGGPGAGKSSACDALGRSPNTVEIDVDAIRRQLPEWDQMVAAGDAQAAEKTHEEASLIAKQIVRVAMHLGFDLLLDGVGRNDDGQFVRRIEAFLRAQYVVTVRYVTVPVDVARDRVAERFEQTGRAVPAEEVERAHAEVAQGFQAVARLPVRVELLDGAGDPAEPIAVSTDGTVEIFNPERYDEFLQTGASDEPVS